MGLQSALEKTLAARLAAPVIVTLMLAAVLVNEWTHQRSSAYRTERAAMVQARVTGMEVLQLLTDAESAQRGFLITGRESYLTPYENARTALPGKLEPTLRYLIAAGESAAADASEARKIVELKLSEMATTIDLYRRGRHEQAVELLLSDIGKDGMDRLRQKMRTALDTASLRDDALERTIRFELEVRRWGIDTLAVLFAVAGIAYARKLANEVRASQVARADLEAEVQVRTTDLRELTSYLQTVQEDARARLSRELHDEMGGLLTAAKFDLMRLRNARDTAQVATHVQQASKRLDEVVAIKRRIIEGLRPSSLQLLGLRQALEILCSEVSQRLEVPVLVRLDEVELRDDVEITIYRLVQEALTNVQKYARADHVGVTLIANEQHVVVGIEDNGAGFDAKATRVARHGLAGMRYRVESFGGQLQVDSAPGRGTRITATLPLQRVARPPAEAAPAPQPTT